jgi:integrase
MPARRTIDPDPTTFTAFQSHKDRQALQRTALTFWDDTDLVFCTGKGLVLHPNNDVRNFATIMRAAGVSEIGVQDLPHTHVTLLLLDGMPWKVISERLEHAKTTITVDTYCHVLASFQRLAVQSIGGASFA